MPPSAVGPPCPALSFLHPGLARAWPHSEPLPALPGKAILGHRDPPGQGVPRLGCARLLLPSSGVAA